MGSISLSIPQAGLANSSEDPKIATDFTTIQTVINGNIDTNNVAASAGITDAQLASPNTGYRKLLLQSTGMVTAGTTSADYLLLQQSGVLASGGSTSFPVPLWAPDIGLSGQPTDFGIAGKTAFGRVRCTIATNATSAAVSLSLGLYLITAVGGSANVTSYTFGSQVAGTGVGIALSASTSVAVEGPAFALPVTGSASTAYALGVLPNGTTAASSMVSITSQLYAYNA